MGELVLSDRDRAIIAFSHAGKSAITLMLGQAHVISERNKKPRGVLANRRGVWLNKIRQHLLSRFWHYHRL